MCDQIVDSFRVLYFAISWTDIPFLNRKSVFCAVYSAIELIIKFNVNPIDITIYEKTNRWGGRIQTETQKSYEYHCGAGRFKKNHINLLKLIKRYGLEHKIYSFDKRKEVRFLMSGNLNII